MSFATGFNTGGSSAFPLSIVKGTAGSSEVAHDPRANRGGAGGLLKATSLTTRIGGKTCPLFNSLPEQWWGTAANNIGVLAPPTGGTALGAFMKFSGQANLAPVLGGSTVIAALYGIPMQSNTAAGALQVISPIPKCYLVTSTSGLALDLTKCRVQYFSSGSTPGTQYFNGVVGGQCLLQGSAQWATGQPIVPALVFVCTATVTAQTLYWSLELLPPAQWGAGFISTNGSGATAPAYMDL